MSCGFCYANGAQACRNFNTARQKAQIRLLKVGITFARRRGMADRTRIEALEERTRRFAIDTVHIVRRAREQPELRPACDQLNSSAGSVAANHRAAGRSRSTKEFAAKLQIVHEEADESAHWLLQLKETNRDSTLTGPIERALREAVELRNIFGRARATTRNRYFPERKNDSGTN